MADPYAASRCPVADPGPTSLGLKQWFDSSAGALEGWCGDWNRYAAWLFSICLRRRVEHGDAQDVVQEVLLALPGFRRFRHNHPGASLRPWLLRVLLNKIGDLHRERARRVLTFSPEQLDAVPQDLRLDPEPSEHHDRDGAAYEVILDRVRRRCAEPNNWLAFRKLVLEGHSAAEVAAELGMSLDRVFTAKARVLRRPARGDWRRGRRLAA